ncbi:MAG TPA: TA system VapC family ribonuclease toxin [Candidatus Solibacter sp.]|nr:TA system VapC family ribonuclease toxin [Candidatus Solibacter sp.]
MPKSTTSFLFPDVNVWLALSYQRHVHHPAAKAWFEQLGDGTRLCFCRFTQLGLLRLLTTDAVMGDDKVLSQAKAWQVYDLWSADDRIHFLEEPSTVEASFRSFSSDTRPAPKDWADSYLMAFASVAGLRLATFDKALHAKFRDALYLG